ncbi:unnamed protein product, partial [Ectocarpus sp. 8 AP-2014]
MTYRSWFLYPSRLYTTWSLDKRPNGSPRTLGFRCHGGHGARIHDEGEAISAATASRPEPHNTESGTCPRNVQKLHLLCQKEACLRQPETSMQPLHREESAELPLP